MLRPFLSWLIMAQKVCKKLVATCSGEPVAKVFVRDDSSGALVENGEINLQDQADAASVGCGVYGIIDRIAKGANVSLASPSNLQFGDYSAANEVYAAESLQAIENLKQQQSNSDEINQAQEDKLASAFSQIEELKAQIEALKKVGE